MGREQARGAALGGLEHGEGVVKVQKECAQAMGKRAAEPLTPHSVSLWVLVAPVRGLSFCLGVSPAWLSPAGILGSPRRVPCCPREVLHP